MSDARCPESTKESGGETRPGKKKRGVDTDEAPRRSGRDAPEHSPPSSPDNKRGPDVVATVALWGVLSAFAALAVGGAWRQVSRARKARVDGETIHGADTAARVSASEADAGDPTLRVLPREPVIGYVTIAPGATSAKHDTSSAAIVAVCQVSVAAERRTAKRARAIRAWAERGSLSGARVPASPQSEPRPRALIRALSPVCLPRGGEQINDVDALELIFEAPLPLHDER